MDSRHTSNKEVGKDLVKGTAVAAVAGATSGAVLGILRQKPVAAYAFSGGLNASLFGMTFIAFRESFLRFQRDKNPYFGLKDSQTMDIDQLWSSTVAGACTGGILAALARGPKAVPSGTFMFSAMAFGGQWIWTKTNRYRQDRILSTTLIDVPSASSSSSSSSTAVGATTRKSGHKDDTVGTGLLNILPVHRTDVDEYEHKLRHKLQLIEEEQHTLEKEVERRKQISTAAAEAAAPGSVSPSVPAIEDSANKDKSTQ
ncbi:hypothetical protein BGZ70_008727 [Mortierella alpina]|uniref:Uncharacterized protein n=1 Tax=Mortierella alpina TaxID=64518 RepID=A0A9P6J2Y7_MORAP|nr:hypothetical protein BGZ70_008727 [Mortierella alpina]